MEWPAPPSGVVRSPLVQEEEEWVWILRSWRDLCKNICSGVGLDAVAAVVMRRKVETGDADCFGGEAPSVHRRNRGLLRRPSSGPSIGRPWS